MRIKIVHYLYPHILGGTTQFLLHLLRSLDKKKFEPIVASFDSGKWVSRFQSIGIQTTVLRLSKDDPKPWIQFLRETNAHIAQTNSYHPTMALAAKRLGIPHIWRLGGHLDIMAKDLKAVKKEDFLNLIVCLSRFVICPSRFIQSQFQSPRAWNLRVIYNGIDTTQTDTIKSGGAQETIPWERNGRFAIAMVAHLHPQKRHLDFIEAAKPVLKEIPQSKFFIFGGLCPYYRRSQEYSKQLLGKVKALGLEKAFVFAESYKGLQKILAQMNLIVLPSVSEGASMAILEAMALGKPVIVSDSGGNSEFVKDGVTGLLVPPRKPEKLAQALLNLFRDPHKAHEMGEEGRKRVKKLFDIRDSVRRYEEIYQEVL